MSQCSPSQKLEDWGFVANGLSGFLDRFERIAYKEIAARYTEQFHQHELLAQKIPIEFRKGRQQLIQYEDIPICMNADGSFHPNYAYFILGLFLNRITQCIVNANVSLHILCLGWNYSDAESWWKRTITKQTEIEEICKKITGYVFSSNAFLAIKSPTGLKEGFHIRTIVWLLLEGHAFGIGWNFHKIGDALHCKVFPVDLLDRNAFVEELLPLFRSELEKRFQCNVAMRLDSIVEVADIKTSKYFPCVPFLARATLYVSMPSSLDTYGEIYSLARKFEFEDEKMLYHLFEKTMLEFTESEVTKQKCIYLPPKLISEKIININDLYLESMDSDGSSTQYVFNGFTQGFVSKSGEMGCSCPVQSCYFDVVDKIQQCQALVVWTQMRITSAKHSNPDI